ncbi:hypothetical protein CEUSTIGMA_g11232.t1 [Chlamydomonas eustigma]|uniref:Telomere-associated protein Rif1 N-terminal domain-containing protein n=1 Tax=Chlamydomonas eustigma TaxID=1157962 RepID=A0A250XL56_9CHLO|nr:hypothetical protein CEUSTIGMA_g11232.t1 [Chlamydomonas eustigma]|eukprot:GAX83807.1 hypothetical protein CEUSTIGMA_g11232.t1 [Chlamydomonas eustigma]
MGNSSHSPCSVHSGAMAASTAHRVHKILEELPVALDSYNPANSDIKKLQTAAKLLEYLKDLLFEALQAGSASNSQGLLPCSDPVSETSTTPENVLQSAMMWGPLVWRGLLVGLDSESSTNSALLVDPGEMIGLSLASAKTSLQSLAVSCMKLMIPVLRDNKAITSALAQDVEADQVLGGMLSILHTSRRSHAGTDSLASTKSKASIGVSIQALKAWVLVVRLMGSAFVSHSKAGQKMLDLIKPQFHQLQPMAVKEEAFHAWVQLAESLSASGSVRKASRYSLLIQPFRHALMYDKEEGMCDVVMKAWCELVYAMRVPDKIQKQPAPTSQAIWTEGKCTGEGTELGNKGTTEQKSAEVEKSHEERPVDGRWRAMAIALTTCGPLGHSVMQLAEATRHKLPPEPAFIQGAVDDTAAHPPRSPVTHVSPCPDIGSVFRVKITVSKDVWCLVVMPVACVVLGLDNTTRPLPQTIQRRALSYLVPLLTKVCNPDNLKDLISLLQQAFSPAVSPHPASPNHSEDQTPHPVSLTPLSAISPLSALLSSEPWQGSQAEHWSELLLYCYANLLDYLDSVFSPLSTNGHSLLEGSATVNHQPLLSPLAAAEPLILSYMPLFTKVLRCMSSACIIPTYAPGESQSEDMIIPEAEQVKRSGALEDQACSWARVVKAVNQMCAITSAFIAAGLLSASAAAAAAAGRTAYEPPAPPQAFIYDLLNGISVTPPGQCTTATMHIDLALCDGRHPGGHLQTVMVMVHTNLKALLLKARPLGVLHVPVKGHLHLSPSDSLTPHAVSRLSGTLPLPAMESAGHLVNSAAPTCYPEARAGPLMNDSSTSGRSCSAADDDEPFRTSWQLLVIAWIDMLKGCRDLISSQEWMEGLSDLAQEAGKYCKDLSSFPLLLSTLNSSHFLSLVVAHGSANKDIAHASHEQDYHILKAWQCVNDSLVSCMASVISSSSIGSTKRAQSMCCVVEVLMFGAEWLVSVGSKRSKGRRASISSKCTEEGAESAMFKETDGIDEGVATELPSEKGSIDYEVPVAEASTLRSMAMDWSICFKMLSEEMKKRYRLKIMPL